MERKSWKFTVPENTKPGTYTFEWIEQCAPRSITECNVRNIEKFEVTVLPVVKFPSTSETPDAPIPIKFKTEITVTDKDVSIVAGKSKHWTRGGNEYTGTVTLHRWYEATGQAASWVSPQNPPRTGFPVVHRFLKGC